MDREGRSKNLEGYCGMDIWKLLRQLGDLLIDGSHMGDLAWRCTGFDYLIQLLLSYTAVGGRKGLLWPHL